MSHSSPVDERPEDVFDEALFDASESEIAALFADAEEALEETNPSEAEDLASHQRIDGILKRAKLETVVSDSASFVFDSFGAGLAGVTDALFSAIEKRPPKNDSF